MIVLSPHNEEESSGRENSSNSYHDPFHGAHDADDEKEVQNLVYVFLVKLHVLK